MKPQTHKSGLYTVKMHEIKGEQYGPERRLRGWEGVLLLLRGWEGVLLLLRGREGVLLLLRTQAWC